MQLSVFEAILSPSELVRLQKRLTSILDPAQDSVRLYPLCGACVPGIAIMGQGLVNQEADFIII